MADIKQKTKQTNTFRYKTFADRVNEIDIRRLALYHIGHANEELPEEDETYFHQTLKKWVVLNLSEEFTRFSKKCMRIVTLPQLVHQKDFVIDTLLECLSIATNLSLQPLLELLYVLARDLREEFYSYFQRVLDRLICLLNTQDAEQLEWTLVCLAYLFKALKPFLKRNIGMVFNAILPLLDEQRYKEELTNFAVECFSFIARDVRDYKKFVDFILDTVVQEQVDSVQGCGRLMFEIMRGVSGLFHSNAGEFLQFMFESVLDESRKSREKCELLQDIVQHAVQHLLQFIHPSNMSLFWQKLCDASQSLKKGSTKFSNILEIFILAAEYRDGRYLSELDLIVPAILKMLDYCMEENNEEALMLIVSLVAKILLSNSTQVTQLDTSRLLKKVLTVKSRKIYGQFIRLIKDHAQFELLVLPALMAHFEQHFDKEAMELLGHVVQSKKPLAGNALAQEEWKAYPLQVKQADSLKKILAKLSKFNDSSKDEEELILLLLLAPHLTGLDVQPLKSILKKATENELSQLTPQTDHATSEKSMNKLSLLLETQTRLKFKLPTDLVEQCLRTLLPFSQYLQALGCIDQLVDQYTKVASNVDLSSHLAPLLSHHNHQVRLMVAHTLQTVHKPTAAKSPYHIFYQAECIEPSVHTYREQLLLLQKLETAGEFFKSFESEECKKDALRFLLGMLYHNFKFVWEPVQHLVEEYAKALSPQDFWDIYKHKLEDVAERIAALRQKGDADASTEDPQQLWLSQDLNDILGSCPQAELSLQDLMNYRNLLWMPLPKFGKVIEMKNIDLVRLFLQFVNEEYRNNLERQEYTWDLSGKTAEDIDNHEEDEQENDDEEGGEKTVRKTSKRKQKQNPLVKHTLQTLQSKMSMFAVYPNPRALNREKELYAFYMDLLASANPLLQKLALDCVSSYKHKAVTPYKEHLYAIVDEKRFKDELINFKLDSVDSTHREDFMRILLPVMYGKLMTKGTQRHCSGQVRKSIVLRFLGQCTTDEILGFLQMAFRRYEKYSTKEMQLERIPREMHEDFQLSAVFSPRKLQSMINLLELVRKEFGGLMAEDFQVYMLKLLVLVGSVCNEVLASDSSVMHAKMPAVYRNVRNAALTSLVNFFGHIDSYPWQLSEIQCLTEVFVRPFIERMPADSIHSPTPLLKLLLQWGEKPQRYEYFNQTKDENGPVIFHYIIELLLSEKAKIVVRRPIMGLIEKLLVSANSEEVIESAVALSVVGPFIPQILKRLRMNFGARSKKQAIDKRDLNILSLLTRHVTEASTCDSLLQLLLPILIAKTQTSTGEEVVCQVITTLSNLIKRLPEPEVYLRRIAPLFAYVQEVQARKMLCDLVGDIAKLRHKQQQLADDKLLERLKLTGRLVFMLNAWDRRWVEQPDYDKRLGALKEISQLLTEDGVDMDLGALIIYNCFYFLKYDKDMGLRDNASEHLQLLLPKLVAKYSGDKAELDYLVDDVFMGLMKRVIRDANDNVRHEAIRLLGVMARECSESHPVLRDLKPLGDAQDAEVDFFENITHLQSHRHGRALLKFCTHAESLKQTPSSRTLTQFILPLASRYLLQEKFAAKHTLIDAAIEAVGVCCQLLPWQNYHSSLRFYLMKMRTVGQEFQKQAVRIVVRVLDAFHFDLSQAHQDQEVMQRMKKELTEKMQKQEEEETKQAERLKKDAEVKAEKVKKEDDDEKDEEDEDEDDEDSEIKEEEDEEESEAEVADVKPDCLVLKSLQLLSPNAARRVMHTITSVLIPTLNRSITEKSSYDTKHKVNRKRFSSEREEEEILRVPIALAMVKLMQKLPKELLDSSVSGVFMKVCTFLRSPLKSVRMLTRDILKKIMLALGASYLATLMDHLQTLLTHGFQVHVLSVTVHGVLDALRENLQPADIESCMGNLLDVALNDIFGDITAEKAVEKITAHTPEAKPSAKSYLVLHIVARNIQEKCLLDLLMPFKDHLARSHSRKLTLKIQDCFAKIVGGLVENPHISRESLLIFIYGTMSESITDLLPGTQKRVLTDQEKEKMRRARPDCYIIQAAPRNRVGAVGRNVKTNAQANAHILIEFGLEMLHIVLKRKKLADVNYPPFLNPILPLLRDSLKSTHIRVTTFALKCFASIWNEGYELPALDEYLGDVVPRLFEILKNFSTFGATKQEENMQLVKSVFKAIVALLRKCTTYELTEEQIDQLVLHIEQDIFEGESQAMSFTLLKALLVRKVHSKALFKVMRKISELSIVSPSDFVRDEARALNAIYVVEYPLKKRIDQVVKFYTVHLCYSVPTGRRSAIAFLETLIKKFPFRMLKRRSEFLYLSLGTRLVNDEDSDCRKAVAECLELLITRVGKEGSRELFDMTLLFFDETNKPSVREMAAALCSRFLNAEKKAFADRVKILLPLLVARLTLSNPRAPGRFVKAPGVMAKPIEESEEGPDKPAKKKSKKSDLTEELVGQEDTEEALASKQRELDHEIIQMQYCLLKMLEYCPEEMLLSQNDEINSLIDELAYESQRLLAHDHSWVRCNAAKIIGHIVARYDYELIGRRLAKVDTESSNTRLPDFIYLNPEYDIKSLVLDLCAQVIPGDTPLMMIDEIVKIFLFVANMLRDVPFTVKRESEEEKENEEGDEKTTLVTKINLNWLMHNIKYLINKEMARAPHCTVMRSALFTLIEGLITLLSVESLEKLAHSFLMCLVREMSEDDQNVDKDLRQLALHVGSRLRKRIGADMYDKLRTSAQTKLMMRRAERKKTIAQEKIHDPVKAAKRKVGIQERKKAAKKRKTEIWRGKAEDVKQKLKKRKRKADDDGF